MVFNALAWNQPAIRFFEKHHAMFLDDWKTVVLDADVVTDLNEVK